MKESEILREVGRRFEEGTPITGICFEINDIRKFRGGYTSPLHRHILESRDWDFKYRKEDQPARALACYWMAHELEEEGR